MENAKTTAPPSRIALFGGSFDPIHCAHLKVAHCALEQAHLDSVVFVPAAQPPLKHKPLSEKSARLHMLHLALKNEANFKLDTYEIERGGVNFTIDTVNYFRMLYGKNTELFYIIGDDQFIQLDKWHCIDELVEKVFFLVCPRLGARFAAKLPVTGLRYQLLKAELMPESSTEIRERCEKRLSLSGLVPSQVESFIYEQGLYVNKQKNT